jgi:hypothetical protein
MRNPFAHGFQHGFLSGPKIEKRRRLLLPRQPRKLGGFPYRKELANQLLKFRKPANLLHVRSDRPGLRDRENSNFFRMRQIEVQRTAWARGELTRRC